MGKKLEKPEREKATLPNGVKVLMTLTTSTKTSWTITFNRPFAKILAKKPNGYGTKSILQQCFDVAQAWVETDLSHAKGGTYNVTAIGPNQVKVCFQGEPEK